MAKGIVRRSFEKLSKKLRPHHQLAPLLLMTLIISVLLVLFRMKTVEQGYEHAKLKRKFDKIVVLDKEVRAKRANLLSIKNLQKYAKKFNLNAPKERQILVVPYQEK